MNHSVRYWEMAGKRHKYVPNEICFARLPKVELKWVKYLAPVDKILNEDKVKFYLEFLCKLLDSSNFKYKIIKVPRLVKPKTKNLNKSLDEIWNGVVPKIEKEFKYENCVVYYLDCSKLNKTKTLLYLTAFRMVDEFPHLLDNFFAETRNCTDFEKLFEEFQNAHYKCARKVIRDKNSNLGGHGLMYQYIWCQNGAKLTPIKFKKFRENLASKSDLTVQGHFFG